MTQAGVRQAGGENLVLGALPADARQRLRPHLQQLVLERGDVLFAPGDSLRYVYFPVTAIVSLLCSTRAGESSAIALTGSEGMVGASVCFGAEIPATRAVVHAHGSCSRAPIAAVRGEFALGARLYALACACMLDTMTQIAQTAVCNRHHKLEQQLCRLLLMTLDRSAGDLVFLTQEIIAGLLGVRREGVSHATRRLVAAGMIELRRGRIRVVDRAGVEGLACECYAIARQAVPSFDPVPDAVLFHQPVQCHARYA